MKKYTIKDVVIYDNGGETADRFTVAFPFDHRNGFAACVGMSFSPFHPQGFCQHGECKIGAHLGKQISYVDLNDDCAMVIRLELKCYNDNAENVALWVDSVVNEIRESKS